MIRVCYICWKIMGEKEPYKDKSMTSGICEECFPGELEKLRKWKEAREKTLPSEKTTSLARRSRAA